MQRAALQLGEIHIQHHHHEQEQHGDGADIDHHQQHRQELGAQEHEQPGGGEEGQDQEQHAVHGIALRDHERGRGHGDHAQHVEGDGLDAHGAWRLLAARGRRVLEARPS